MKILAIDTAADACSAAISVDGVVDERYELAPRRHAELILPMVDDLLHRAGLRLTDLDAIAFGRGPGAFTGLRIAAGVAQGLALAAGCPVLGVSDLQALAAALAREADDDPTGVVVAQDARMGEVYAGAWGLGGSGLEPVVEETVAAPESLRPLPAGRWIAAGTGFSVHGEALQVAWTAEGVELEVLDSERLPRAGEIARLAGERLAAGEGGDPAEAVPVYLRDEVAWRT